VLNGLSFEIKEGETVAFVGPIGCGKSTIMNLILRFLDPQAGKILVEGKDISEVTLKSLREQVSKLSQFPFFLKDTIRENVRLGKANASEEEIIEACRLAQIHDIIMDEKRIPEGYDTVIADQIPSGGQKRLIALARCLVRKPEVLILDEPTENLDEEVRNRLVEVIKKYVKNPENRKTCLVISHDLKFVSKVADRIIVLDEGRVADIGTHAELIQREGIYKRLLELETVIEKIDPKLFRTGTETEKDGETQGVPGAAIPGMGMPGPMGPGGMGGMSMPR
nr:ATP-binding cassette domain-containing protein [Acidobacteriota bacterium]